MYNFQHNITLHYVWVKNLNVKLSNIHITIEHFICTELSKKKQKKKNTPMQTLTHTLTAASKSSETDIAHLLNSIVMFFQGTNNNNLSQSASFPFYLSKASCTRTFTIITKGKKKEKARWRNILMQWSCWVILVHCIKE